MIQREKEAQFHPCKSLARQPQLTAEARCKLVSWLIPVHKHFRLSFECCCLAVNIMDRFLASTPVAADCFQLLGVTALLLASKQVEVCSPRISHLLSLCCNVFTKEQLCNLECLVLLRLNFRLSAPTLAFFLDYYTNCIEAAQLVTGNRSDDGFSRMNPDTKTSSQCSKLAQKVCELSLADYAFNKYPPSLTASCALRVAVLQTELNLAEMQIDGKTFDGICPNQMGQTWKRAVANKTDKVLVPRSSSPVTVYVELPCIIEQAFSTIAWDDLEDCASAVRQERDSLGSQVNQSDANDQDFGEYGLDFMAESPTTLESNLSPDELVPFQGCIIPPLTPQRDFSPENSLVNSSTETGNPPAQDGDPWKGIAECHGRALGHSIAVNKQLHESLHTQQEEIDSLEERNLHLRQLASRAKHLASVLEKLMTVRDSHVREPVMPCGGDKASLSPCKRQRLDEGYETESSDSVEDMLRDISTRCNAVLHSRATETRLQQDLETICMYGAFSGLQTSIAKDSAVTVDAAEAGESVSSFRTSVREHCTIRTQVFPHGHAFTSRTQQGGYRFRWVPNQS
ncbi:cyclin-O [Archocentrus centrarchus]|uniref:cyclin-O n=1 Tax=Archocentrus centrarchus TaxID=63155 RepID=UPI0011EA3CEE|nr:multicilin-like [Archocentrus centrarchus]